MGVLLAIVKFIGIALLVLLALLLLLLLVILFVPIRYQAEITCYNQQLSVKAKVSYLLQIFRVTAGYSTGQPVHYSCKLFWFILFADEDSVKKVARKTKKAGKKAVKSVEKVNKDFTEEAKQKTGESGHNEGLTEQKTEDDDYSSGIVEPKMQGNNTNKEMAKQIHPPSAYMDEDYEEEDAWYEDSYEDIYESSTLVPKKAKSSSFFDSSHSRQGKKEKKKFSIRGFWESLKTKLKAFIAKLKACCQRFLEVKEKGRLLKKLYDSEVTKRAFDKVKKQAFYLLRHLKPRVIKGVIHYGFDDPAATGEVLVGISMFYPVLAPHFDIVPDFYNTCLEGEIKIMGHIRLVHVAIAAITLFFDGAIKKTIKRFKRITGGNE